MAVITISRELGSCGEEIIESLCDAVGVCSVGKDMLMHIAEEAGIDVAAIEAMEKNITNRARLVSDEMTSLYRKQRGAFEQRGVIDDKTYLSVLKETMERYAAEGKAIIVGRGSQMLLRDWPDALHVRLYAPVDLRAQRISEREGISLAVASQRIKKDDERKRQYIRRMFKNADWRNGKYYNLTIDTGRISPETAAKMIITAMEDIDKRKGETAL